MTSLNSQYLFSTRDELDANGVESLPQTWIFPLSLQPGGVNLWYFKLRLPIRVYILKYLRSTTLGCKDRVCGEN